MTLLGPVVCLRNSAFSHMATTNHHHKEEPAAWHDKWSHCQTLDNAVDDVAAKRAASFSQNMSRAVHHRRHLHTEVRLQASQWTDQLPGAAARRAALVPPQILACALDRPTTLEPPLPCYHPAEAWEVQGVCEELEEKGISKCQRPPRPTPSAHTSPTFTNPSQPSPCPWAGRT